MKMTAVPTLFCQHSKDQKDKNSVFSLNEKRPEEGKVKAQCFDDC